MFHLLHSCAPMHTHSADKKSFEHVQPASGLDVFLIF
jgi:hypothetical protein